MTHTQEYNALSCIGTFPIELIGRAGFSYLLKLYFYILFGISIDQFAKRVYAQKHLLLLKG